MKKMHLLFSFALLLFMANVSAQHSILEKNKEWLNSCTINVNNSTASWSVFYRTGDSVIVGGYTYTKVIFNNINSVIDIAYLREDGLKTFQLQGTVDVLLFDFGLQVGDSIFRSPIDVKYFKCVGIDSVLVDGMYAKRVSVIQHLGYATKWIEGVGDEQFGVFGVTDPFVGSNAQLVCVKVDQQTIYSTNGYCWVSSINQIPETITMNNPVYDNLQVAFNGTLYSSYQILSIEGRVVAESNLGNSDNANIDFRQFPNGIYVVVFAKKTGERQSYRLMKL